uniref:Uncharacterized protein n=1 Tax=Ciona intestinalis TaxID=7719 RepID=H2XX20_CIOIN
MGEYANPLFGCFEDPALCIITFIIPCYTAGKTAESLGESCLLYGILYLFTECIAGCIIRGKVREIKNIDGTMFKDFVLSLFCPWCALIQDHREVDNTKYDQSIARV